MILFLELSCFFREGSEIISWNLFCRDVKKLTKKALSGSERALYKEKKAYRFKLINSPNSSSTVVIILEFA